MGQWFNNRVRIAWIIVRISTATPWESPITDKVSCTIVRIAKNMVH
jgi:hypothetical protein